LTCELRDDSECGAGWEVLLRIDGEIALGHRSETESTARHWANVFRQDHVRTGWKEDTPTLEHRAVDVPKTFTYPNCDRHVPAPREEPWLIHGEQQYAPTLVAFACPHCEHEITITIARGMRPAGTDTQNRFVHDPSVADLNYDRPLTDAEITQRAY